MNQQPSETILNHLKPSKASHFFSAPKHLLHPSSAPSESLSGFKAIQSKNPNPLTAGRILIVPPARIGKVDGTPDLSGRRAAFYDVLPDKSGVPVAVSVTPIYGHLHLSTPKT
jgi:hypothetical protein